MANDKTDMDRASVILAARSITNDLQTAAERLARLEANSVMPLLDSIRINFSSEVADQFDATSTEALRGALEAIKVAKDTLGRDIDNMERIMGGEAPITDMGEYEGEPEVEMTINDSGDTEEEEVEVELSDDDIEDMFSEVPDERIRKESYSLSDKKMIVESILSYTKRGETTVSAMAKTAYDHGISPTQLVSIIKEAKLGKFERSVLDILTPVASSGAEYVDFDFVIKALSDMPNGIVVDRDLVSRILSPERLPIIKSVEGDRVYFKAMDMARERPNDRKKNTDKVKQTAEKEALDNVRNQ